MKFRTFMLIAAVIALIYGLGFLFIPATMMGFYGLKLNDPARFLALYFGSTLLGVAVTWWRVEVAKTRYEENEGVLLGGITLAVTGLIVAVLDAMSGASNSSAWVNVVIYGLLTAGFIFFYFKNKE